MSFDEKLISKKNIIDDNFINNISASFQKCVANILTKKIDKAIKNIARIYKGRRKGFAYFDE